MTLALISNRSLLSVPPDRVAAPPTTIAPLAASTAPAVLSSSSAVTDSTPAPSSSVIVANVALAAELTVRLATALSVTAPRVTSPVVEVIVLVPTPDRLMVRSVTADTLAPCRAIAAARSAAPLLMVNAPPAVMFALISIASSLSIPPASVTAPSAVIAPADSKVAAAVLSSSSAVMVTAPPVAPASSSVITAVVTLPVELITRFASPVSPMAVTSTSPAVDVIVLVPVPERLISATPPAALAVTLAPVRLTFAARSMLVAVCIVRLPADEMILALMSKSSSPPVPSKSMAAWVLIASSVVSVPVVVRPTSTLREPPLAKVIASRLISSLA